MTDSTGHNNNKRTPGQDDLFDHFPPQEKDLAQQIWEKSPHAAPEFSPITENETERALTNVHYRIANPRRKSTGKQNHASTGWKWIAAAAAVLLILGTGWLFTPKTVTAPYGEITSIDLPDGSTVDLNSGSQIQYNRLFSFANRTVTLEGEAFFDVESGERPFIVNTHNSTVRVTGTKFNVRSWSEEPGQETEVTVSEGRVQFYPTADPDSLVTISPGQLSRFTTELDKPTPPASVAIDRFLGWRNNKFIFNDKTLGVILRELERRFDVNIELQEKNAVDETLTTYYANPKGVESILKDICRVKGLHYAKTANGFRVY